MIGRHWLAGVGLLIMVTGCRSGPAPQVGDTWVGPPGSRVRVHLAGSGPPTIVLISGLGGGIADWAAVMDSFATRGTVVAYDRPGIGASDPGEEPRSVARMAGELHALLGDLNLPPPYVLCGHSLGGFVAQAFAVRYPEDVAGVLLIDPSVETFYARAETLPSYRENRARNAERQRSRPPGAFAEATAFATSRSEVRDLGPMPVVPIRMLISIHHGTWPTALETLWRTTHVEWTEAHPRGSYVIAETSGHYVQRDNPGLVIANLDSLGQAIREGGTAGGRSQ